MTQMTTTLCRVERGNGHEEGPHFDKWSKMVDVTQNVWSLGFDTLLLTGCPFGSFWFVLRKKTAILSGGCGVSIYSLASSEARHAPLGMVSFGSFWFVLNRNQEFP